jgi:hypothetical protein
VSGDRQTALPAANQASNQARFQHNSPQNASASPGSQRNPKIKRLRRASLSLHTLQDFIGMEKHENFSYEVLFGDKNAISQMLGEPQRV